MIEYTIGKPKSISIFGPVFADLSVMQRIFWTPALVSAKTNYRLDGICLTDLERGRERERKCAWVSICDCKRERDLTGECVCVCKIESLNQCVHVCACVWMRVDACVCVKGREKGGWRVRSSVCWDRFDVTVDWRIIMSLCMPPILPHSIESTERERRIKSKGKKGWTLTTSKGRLV